LHLWRQRTHRFPHQQLTKEKATMTVKPIPEDYHTVTPYLTVEGAAKLIDFLIIEATVDHEEERARGVRVGKNVVPK
jgi:hypothetical protein